jgi:hypothetical protein
MGVSRSVCRRCCDAYCEVYVSVPRYARQAIFDLEICLQELRSWLDVDKVERVQLLHLNIVLR